MLCVAPLETAQVWLTVVVAPARPPRQNVVESGVRPPVTGTVTVLVVAVGAPTVKFVLL